jgi:hypothetical protein
VNGVVSDGDTALPASTVQPFNVLHGNAVVQPTRSIVHPYLLSVVSTEMSPQGVSSIDVQLLNQWFEFETLSTGNRQWTSADPHVVVACCDIARLVTAFNHLSQVDLATLMVFPSFRGGAA